MSGKISAPRKWREDLEYQRTKLENKIQQLTSELDKAKKEYENLKIVLDRTKATESEDFEDENDTFSFEDDNNYEDEDNPPKKWLRSEYQNLPMEEAVFDVLKECQPARPGDIALRMYNIREDDQNFRRIRNSVNSTLSLGKSNGKWKALSRGVYALNSYPDSLNGHH